MKLFAMGKFEDGYEVEKAFNGVMIEATEDELIKIKEVLGKEVTICARPRTICGAGELLSGAVMDQHTRTESVSDDVDSSPEFPDEEE